MKVNNTLYSLSAQQLLLSPVLYMDNFVKLTEDFLVIKKYCFATLKPKVVRLRDIRTVYFDEQKNTKFSHRRIWGRAPNSIYWAADFKRSFHSDKNCRSDVIIDIEDGLLKGFTVADVQAFLTYIRLYCPNSTVIIDNLNV